MWISVTIHTFRSSPHEALLSLLTMTSFTRNLIVYTFDSKGAKIVILTNVHSPAIRCMAPLTITTLSTLVHIHMAGLTRLRYASIFITHMAFTTFGNLVLSFQCVCGLFGMIKIL